MVESATDDKVRPPSPMEEGEVYVHISGTYYVKPDIDADKVRDTLKNNYVTEQVERLKSLLFTDEVIITVVDENDREYPQVARDITAMTKAPGVKLWARMQQAWVDMFSWGPALFNPVWGRDLNEVVLRKLRRLPPETFSEGPGTTGFDTSAEILEGILVNKLGFTEYWQTQVNGKTQQIHNVVMMKDPTSTEFAGTSKVIPIIPIITMLDFSHQAQMQKVNRVGSPSIFIKFIKAPIKNNDRDDIKWAQQILQNWGKDTAFLLRDNMEIVQMNPTVTQSALETIQHLEKRIQDYFSPSTLIKKEGNTIGATGASEVELVHEWMEAQHRMIEGEFEPILQKYLDANGYVGLRVELDIPEVESDKTDLHLQQMNAAISSPQPLLTPDEMRELMGFESLTPEEWATLREQHKASAPAPASPFGFKGEHPGCQDHMTFKDLYGPADGSAEDMQFRTYHKEQDETILEKNIVIDDENLFAAVLSSFQNESEIPIIFEEQIAMEKLAQELHDKTFLDLTEEQQKEIIRKVRELPPAEE